MTTFTTEDRLKAEKMQEMMNDLQSANTVDELVQVSAKWSQTSNSWTIINHEAIRQEERKRKKK
jgi:hypothetical protein